MYYSVLLKPPFPSSRWFGLSFIACLAIRDVIASYLTDQTIGLKWPNDVVIAGRGKLCGILMEVVGDNLIVGTGVNITPIAPLADAPFKPVAMDDFGETSVAPHALATAYQTQLARRYAAYVETGFTPVRSEWLSHCVHRRQVMTVHLAATAISGVFADLGEDGTLHLLADDGTTHHISTGDVELMGQV
jgi:BirA family biotin operon repressor/biotin-[acetyl-CoA-carboxylase] ligase